MITTKFRTYSNDDLQRYIENQPHSADALEALMEAYLRWVAKL